MLQLPRTAQAAPDQVKTVFKEEIATLTTEDLPLQQGMTHGSFAQDDQLSAMVIRVTDEPDRRVIHAGLFFTSLAIGCACTNDPTPLNDEPEYSEAIFEIDRPSGTARVRLLD